MLKITTSFIIYDFIISHLRHIFHTFDNFFKKGDIILKNNLKICRKEIGITQTELGEILGVKKATISNWENGYDVIPLPHLIKFCNLYNFSIDFAIGLSEKNIKIKKTIEIDPIKIGKKLKELRIKLNLTQQDIADECSIVRTTLSNYELGINLISTSTLYTICKNHKISIDWLCGKSNNKILQ